METVAEHVEGNRYRLNVEVGAEEIDAAVAAAVRTMTRNVRIPGFRPGKVPRQVLEAHLGGAGVIREEALREAIPDFYARAVNESGIDPIDAPKIDITGGKESGALEFAATVEVRPTILIPGYGGLQVTVPSPIVSDEEVEAQINAMREVDATLAEVDRPVADGDHVNLSIRTTDAAGTEIPGLSQEELLHRMGSGGVLPGLDEQLAGAAAGEERRFTTPVGPEDDPTEVTVEVTVRRVNEQQLPELTDEWAAESSEQETVEELRGELAKRIGENKRAVTRAAIEREAIKALIELVEDEVVPEVLVEGEVHERLHGLRERLEAQGISIEQFLTVTGTGPEALMGRLREEAGGSVKADLALRAIVVAEEIDVSDEEFEADLAASAEEMGVKAAVLRERMEHAGRIAGVRSEMRKAKALRWLVEHVDVVDDAGSPVSREGLSPTGTAKISAVEGGSQ